MDIIHVYKQYILLAEGKVSIQSCKLLVDYYKDYFTEFSNFNTIFLYHYR
jgi:hypothetical protein